MSCAGYRANGVNSNQTAAITDRSREKEMNIQEAKEEICNTVRAYLAKDEDGYYVYPLVRQRPILLIGPPGIGKTAIMEQAAAECKVGLVSYTITHHTRQSAIGLPEIVERNYGGKGMMVTDYTMSEIVASVYDCMENTGKREGILFIDEINCVSETLAPAMLALLQNKTFGSHKIPEGWILVAAGNPPEYNKSVREFDIVTLDRVRKLEIEPDCDIWLKYAGQRKVHQAIISYLSMKKERFYSVENTVDGKFFVTARGWEDLSRLIQVYEALGKEVDREVVYQYIQHPMIAKDFAAYLALYNKYKTDYAMENLLLGKWTQLTIQKIRNASLDEHLSLVGLLNGKLSQLFTECYLMDSYVTKLYEYMVYYRDNLADISLKAICRKAENDLESARKSELLTGNEEKALLRVNAFLEKIWLELGSLTQEEQNLYEKVKEAFSKEADGLEEKTEAAAQTLQNVFDFMEAAFGDSQEMVAFITELNANFYSIWFIRENGSDQYYRHNKGLLFDNRQKLILGQMEELESTMERGITDDI